MKWIAHVGGSFAAAFLTLQSLAPRTPEPGPPPAVPGAPVVRVVRWQHGDPQQRLIPADRGFCYVSGMGGHFAGGGEGVRVFVDDGIWFVAGHSCQPSLWVDVTCVEWPVVRLSFGGDEGAAR